MGKLLELRTLTIDVPSEFYEHATYCKKDDRKALLTRQLTTAKQMKQRDFDFSTNITTIFKFNNHFYCLTIFWEPTFLLERL